MLLAVLHRIMEHLESLESTRYKKLELLSANALSNSYASLVLFKLPTCAIIQWCTRKHELIVISSRHTLWQQKSHQTFVLVFFPHWVACKKKEYKGKNVIINNFIKQLSRCCIKLIWLKADI